MKDIASRSVFSSEVQTPFRRFKSGNVCKHAVAVLVGCIAIMPGSGSAIAQTDPQAAIEAGRRALRDTGGLRGFRWYNSADDKTQAIEVPPQRNWDRLEAWLEWLETIFDFSANWDWRQLFATLGWIVVAVVLGVLVWLIIRTYLTKEALHSTSQATPARGARGHLIDRVEALPVAVRDPHADFLAEARRHYQAGNLGEAIIYLFSFQLLELDKHNLLRLAKGKTNRQYLREVSRANAMPPVSRLFERSMLLFEASFFGGHHPQRPAFETVWNDLNVFQAHLAQRSEAVAR